MLTPEPVGKFRNGRPELFDAVGGKELKLVQILLKQQNLSMRVTRTSWHISGSRLLPVYEIVIPDCQLRIYARHNYYDWAVTVESGNPMFGVDAEHLNSGSNSSCYFEGFERGELPVYTNGYTEGCTYFSCSIGRRDVFKNIILHLAGVQ